MTTERIIRAAAGTFVLASLAIGFFLTPWAYLFTAFVGANLLQSAFTGLCPLESILKACGVASNCGVQGGEVVNSTAGASLDLDAVIRRHGGESEQQVKAYRALPSDEREALLAFLRGLTLYSVDDVPGDIDGDGIISPHVMVAGKDTGVERLNPEWLFRVPGRIEGMVTNPNGERVLSLAPTNVEEAYGGTLKFLRDDDGDRFPDARFPAPGKSLGYEEEF